MNVTHTDRAGLHPQEGHTKVAELMSRRAQLSRVLFSLSLLHLLAPQTSCFVGKVNQPLVSEAASGQLCFHFAPGAFRTQQSVPDTSPHQKYSATKPCYHCSLTLLNNNTLRPFVQTLCALQTAHYDPSTSHELCFHYAVMIWGEKRCQLKAREHLPASLSWVRTG